jgi:uncharacterized membrane protein (DUF106 family)
MTSLTTMEIIALVGIFSTIGAAWMNARISIAKLQVEVENVKKEIKEDKDMNEKAFDKIDKKLDSIMDKLTNL